MNVTTGADTGATFALEDEDHTLANALRFLLNKKWVLNQSLWRMTRMPIIHAQCVQRIQPLRKGFYYAVLMYHLWATAYLTPQRRLSTYGFRRRVSAHCVYRDTVWPGSA